METVPSIAGTTASAVTPYPTLIPAECGPSVLEGSASPDAASAAVSVPSRGRLAICLSLSREPGGVNDGRRVDVSQRPRFGTRCRRNLVDTKFCSDGGDNASISISIGGQGKRSRHQPNQRDVGRLRAFSLTLALPTVDRAFRCGDVSPFMAGGWSYLTSDIEPPAAGQCGPQCGPEPGVECFLGHEYHKALPPLPPPSPGGGKNKKNRSAPAAGARQL